MGDAKYRTLRDSRWHPQLKRRAKYNPKHRVDIGTMVA